MCHLINDIDLILLLLVYSVLHDEIFFESTRRRAYAIYVVLMIVLAICIVGLVVAAFGMYRSWQNFTSGGYLAY